MTVVLSFDVKTTNIRKKFKLSVNSGFIFDFGLVGLFFLRAFALSQLFWGLGT